MCWIMHLLLEWGLDFSSYKYIKKDQLAFVLIFLMGRHQAGNIAYVLQTFVQEL